MLEFKTINKQSPQIWMIQIPLAMVFGFPI